MKANELMIGDWVKFGENDKYSGCIGKIMTLRYHQQDDGAYFFVFVNGDKGVCTTEVFNEDIVPIPLTPEILEKNFPTYEGLAWKPSDMTDTIPAFTIRIDEDFAHIEIELRYVHELQHALCLCGIDKEIEL